MKKNRFHRFLRIFLAIIVIVLLVCTWLMLSHGSAPSPQELADKPHRLTVLTWNTNAMSRYQKAERNEVLRYLKSQNADVIFLQEVDVYKNDRYLTLPEVRAVMSAKYPYSYIDFSVYDQRHQFGTMVWSKYPLIHKQSIHYETKGNLSNRCDMVIGSDTIRLINNHLESYSLRRTI